MPYSPHSADGNLDTGASRACYMWHIFCGMDESARYTNTVPHLTELAPNTKGLWCRVGIRKNVMCAAAWRWCGSHSVHLLRISNRAVVWVLGRCNDIEYHNSSYIICRRSRKPCKVYDLVIRPTTFAGGNFRGLFDGWQAYKAARAYATEMAGGHFTQWPCS